MKNLILIIIIALFAFVASPIAIYCQSQETTSFTEFSLPGEVDKIILAKKGEILLLQMNKLGKVALFDVKTEKIIGNVSLGGNDTMVAGTAESIIFFARDKKVFQRWSIDPLLKTITMPAPETEVAFDSIIAGYDSTGPVMLINRIRPIFFDSTSLQQINTEKSASNSVWCPSGWSSILLVLPADKSIYKTEYSNNNINNVYKDLLIILKKNENKDRRFFLPVVGGAFSPTTDGSLSVTGFLGEYGNIYKQPNDSEIPTTFPTIHPSYYVSVTSKIVNNKEVFAVSLCIRESGTIIYTFNNLPGIDVVDTPNSSKTWNARADCIVAHPDAKKLIYLDIKRNLLYIIPFDVKKILGELNINFLFVESRPITIATKDKKYEYAVKVESKAGKVIFKLDSGPEGMTISPDGLLQWNVPSTFAEFKTSVIVSIEDAAKKSIFHSFVIEMGDTSKATLQK